MRTVSTYCKPVVSYVQAHVFATVLCFNAHDKSQWWWFFVQLGNRRSTESGVPSKEACLHIVQKMDNVGGSPQSDFGSASATGLGAEEQRGAAGARASADAAEGGKILSSPGDAELHYLSSQIDAVTSKMQQLHQTTNSRRSRAATCHRPDTQGNNTTAEWSVSSEQGGVDAHNVMHYA